MYRDKFDPNVNMFYYLVWSFLVGQGREEDYVGVLSQAEMLWDGLLTVYGDYARGFSLDASSDEAGFGDVSMAFEVMPESLAEELLVAGEMVYVYTPHRFSSQRFVVTLPVDHVIGVLAVGVLGVGGVTLRAFTDFPVEGSEVGMQLIAGYGIADGGMFRLSAGVMFNAYVMREGLMMIPEVHENVVESPELPFPTMIVE